MTIAVVGAGGFLGGHLAKALAAAGREVLELRRGDPLPARPVEVLIDCNGDARRFWANANPGASFKANVASVAERATAGITRRYVFISTMDVYGSNVSDRAANAETAAIDPAGLDVYAFHKWLAEQVVARHGADPLILRLGTLIGPGLKKNPVFDALNGHPIRQTADSALSLLDLDHAGRAISRLLDLEARGVYNVTASRSISVARVLELAEAATGRPAPPFHAELLRTGYDLNIDKLAALFPMPDSEAMLSAAIPLMLESES